MRLPGHSPAGCSRNPRFAWGVLPVVLLLLLPGVAAGQRVATVTGHVVTADSSRPIAGAVVSVPGSAATTRTAADGSFRLDGAPAGNQVVEVRRLGYGTARREVSLLSGDLVTLEFRLSSAPADVADIVVIGSPRDRDEREERMAEVPGGVALIPVEEIQATRQANLKDVLQFTPGVYVQPRFGAADEMQISIRGSGLRNNFHARGVNLLVNGMPYRNADGFTDFESLELLTTESIEVYKGGNALRFGGSTLGGAINMETRTGYSAQRLSAFGQGGSNGFYKGQIASGGVTGKLDWYGSYARTSLDGFREWSDQGRDRVNLHAGYLLSPATDIRTFYFFAHVNEHLPGSQTAEALEATPRAADANNVANRWGRDYDLHHVGLQLRSRLSPTQRLEISPYFQYRDIDHPIFQVINQQSRDVGAEVRYENTTPIGGMRSRLTVGVQPAWMDMDHRRFQNVGGEHGDLTKDQRDEASTLAAYAEHLLELGGRISLVTGVRVEHAVRKATDFFMADGNQSDRRSYSPVSPKVGMLYDLPEVQGQLFANASRSFEPPLLSELNSLTVPGFIALEGQAAWQFEIGARGRSGRLSWDVSAYDVELRNEILNSNVQPFPGAPFTVPTYRNTPKSRHMGLETGFEYGTDAVRGRLSYTLASYRFIGDPAFGDNDIPGAPRHHLSAEVRYRHPSGLSLVPSVEWVPSAYFVNSANTDTNRSWGLVNVRAEWLIAGPGVTLFAEGRNLGNSIRSASVQVDNAARRYYEPMDGRAIYAGFRWGR